MNSDNEKCRFIGMLHVPVNTILAAPEPWRDSLPAASADDWELAAELEQRYGADLAPGSLLWRRDHDTLLAGLEEGAEGLSFLPRLWERLEREADLYHRHGADALMLENIAAPYFVRDGQPAVIVAVMSLLAGRLRKKYPNLPLGIQILAFSDDLAMAVALRHGLDFVRSETALFGGLRPEGPTPNHGNLAGLYAMRNRWLAGHPGAKPPRVLADLRKKHTFFARGLRRMSPWLENLRFQKVEAAVLTGPATGQAVSVDELHGLRRAVDRIEGERRPWLVIGSGVSPDNLAVCRHYADAVIVGSSLKEGGYWENPLDEDRLRRFMQHWRRNQPGGQHE